MEREQTSANNLPVLIFGELPSLLRVQNQEEGGLRGMLQILKFLFIFNVLS